MRSRTPILLGVWLFACLLLAGCDDSKSPLSDPTKGGPDKRLTGIWQHQNDDSTTYYHVGLVGGNAPPSMMRVVTITHEKNGQLQEPHQALLFPTDTGGNSYLNVAPAEQSQIAKVQEEGWKSDLFDSYFILKYRVDGEVLLAWIMNNEAKRTAIEAGKIKGEIKNDGRVARFTDTSQNVAKFVAAASSDLFVAEPLRFERVR